MADRKTLMLASLPLPVMHLALCVVTQLVRHTETWPWLLPYAVDLPLSLVLVPLSDRIPPLVVFGVLGTAWWYVINRVAVAVAVRVAERKPPPRRPTAGPRRGGPTS
jgi:hypothetical protein